MAEFPLPARPLARLMAMLIDLTTLIFLYVGGFFLCALWLFSQVGHLDLQELLMAALAVVASQVLVAPLLLTFVYFVIFHSLGGRTIGKLCMGLHVVMVDGGSLSLGTSFLRYVGYIVSAMPLGLGYLWAFLGEENVAWHDRLSGTMVLEDDAGG